MKIIAGNYYNKYESKNFLERYLVRQFVRDVKTVVSHCCPKQLFEVGCGIINLIREQLTICSYRRSGLWQIILAKKIVSGNNQSQFS